MTDQIVLVRTSPRMPAGLLSADGWAALGRGPVYARDPDADELATAVRASGIEVTRLDIPPPVGGSLLTLPPGIAAARAIRAIAATAGGTVVWLLCPEDAELGSALADLAAREGEIIIEVVVASWDPPGSRLLDAVAVMDRLRAPGGCPWDAEQTHASLAPYLIEEAHEAADALAAEDLDALREELGDVLLQVLFHARLAEEIDDDEQRWTIDDVAGGLVDKLIRRHPHVFADAVVADADGVIATWEELKAAEKPERTEIFDGVTAAQPALQLAHALQARVARAGFDWDGPRDAAIKVRAELDEFLAATDDESRDRELGDLLLAVVSLARVSRSDPEAALRAAAGRFRRRVQAVATAAGAPLATLSAADWHALWDQAKERE